MIHEVYYSGRDDSSPVSMSEKPACIVGEDIKEMKRVIAKMKKAFDKPVLDDFRE